MINAFLTHLDNIPLPPGGIYWPEFEPREIDTPEQAIRDLLIGTGISRYEHFLRCAQLTYLVANSPFAAAIEANDPRITYSAEALRGFFDLIGTMVTASSVNNPKLVFGTRPDTPDIYTFRLRIATAAAGTGTMEYSDDTGITEILNFTYTADNSSVLRLPLDRGSVSLYGGTYAPGEFWQVVHQGDTSSWVSEVLPRVSGVNPPLSCRPPSCVSSSPHLWRSTSSQPLCPPLGCALTDLVSRLRQSDLPSISSSFSAWVEIDGTEYAVVKIAVRYARTETKLVVDLASGNASRDIGGRRAIPSDFKFIRGTPARALLRVDREVPAGFVGANDPNGAEPLLKAGLHVLMNGVIDEGGPADLASGRFNMRCIIMSKLSYLATGSTHFTNVSGSQLDTTRPVGFTSTQFPGALTPDNARSDFWRATRTALNAILDARSFFGQNRVQTFLDFANQELGDPPQTAINALASIPGSLPGGIFANSDMARVVARYVSRELARDIGRQSILGRIQGLAEDFFFALIEHGEGYGIVPYTAFAHSSECKKIWPSTLEGVQWKAHNTAQVAGLVFIDNPYGQLTGVVPTGQDPAQFILGGFKRRAVESAKNEIDQDGNGLGLFTTLPAPSWMHARREDGSGGEEVRNLTPEVVASGVRETYGNVYAREIALRQSFVGRMISVKCPLRMDVGPCAPVHIIYPALAGTGVEEDTSMYGSVEAVTLVIDATSKKAGTELEVMYVRSQAQQELDVDERPTGSPGFGGQGGSYVSTTGFHPLWARPYLGRRLDESVVAGEPTVDFPVVSPEDQTEFGE